MHIEYATKMFSSKIRKGKTRKKVSKTDTFGINLEGFEEGKLIEAAALVGEQIFLNSLLKRIVFKMDNVIITNKFSYILLECIIYVILAKYKKEVYITGWPAERTILAAGIQESLLSLVIQNKIRPEEYINQFCKFKISNTSFRKVLHKDSVKENTLSILMGDIKAFLEGALYKLLNDSQAYLQDIKSIAEIIVELAGNVVEHAECDCIIDVDLTDNWYSNSNQEEKFWGINIVVLNFSEKLISYDVLQKLLKNEGTENEEFTLLRKAYRYHSLNFDSNYTEEDFGNIAVFQNKISGRKNKVTGGTGLYTLLTYLLNKADLEHCFMRSGNKGIRFLHYLQEDTVDGWFGFNRTNNFLSDIPDKEIILHKETFFPGTVFNLHLIYKRSR